MITINILNANNEVIESDAGETRAFLACDYEYQPGDKIEFIFDKVNCFYNIMVDDAVGDEVVYVTDKILFTVPFEEKKVCYSPRAFTGAKQLITARPARADEITGYRLLSRNRMDQHEFAGNYPHASANVETRGESVFAARNAIDGIYINDSHGEWPYGSWGINQDPNAIWHLDFGRDVIVDKVVIFERADFPHDAWWNELTVSFSDGSSEVLKAIKTEDGQEFTFAERKINGLSLEKLIKADDPSPFPALCQIEVFGHEA